MARLSWPGRVIEVVCMYSDERGTGLLERITNDHRSLLQLQLYDVSDRDSGTCRSLTSLCFSITQSSSVTGFPRFLESPGIFSLKFPGPGKSWKISLIMVSPGN